MGSVGIMDGDISMALVIPCDCILGSCCAMMDTEGSLLGIGISRASWADTGRTCSGAHRYSLLA